MTSGPAATRKADRLMPPERSSQVNDPTRDVAKYLGEFLAESDLVKFARHLPTIADSERAWEAAARFVEETSRPIEVEERRAVG